MSGLVSAIEAAAAGLAALPAALAASEPADGQLAATAASGLAPLTTPSRYSAPP